MLSNINYKSLKTMKKICFFIGLTMILNNQSYAQKEIADTPQAHYCDEDPNTNPFGFGPLQPEWFYQPYKIFTACPQIFVGLGEVNPKYLLDARKGTGRFHKVRTNVVQAGTIVDPGTISIGSPNYPGNGILNAYGVGSLLELRGLFGQLIFSVNSSGAVRINNKSSSTAPLVIKSSNNSKILQLDNNGTLHARQIEVDTDNWPDYVFKKGYKLMTLEEVAAYIIKHKHLPNISAAIDLEKGKLNLGNMQKLLMEKVEELTIYTIQQNEQIKSLQKHNQQLQTELNELKNEVVEIKKNLNK